MLERETKYFEKILPDLVKTNLGKYVLIKNESTIGTFDSMGDALRSGYEKFLTDSFFVRQILPLQQPASFTNNFLFA